VTRTIDIFCGAGGLSEGFREAGFDIRLGLDLAKHACATHEANFSEAATWCRDVRDVTGKEIKDAMGGPVCPEQRSTSETLMPDSLSPAF
jgi:site-specific DNA-cytosine methylase